MTEEADVFGPIQSVTVTGWYDPDTPGVFEVTDTNGQCWEVIEGDQDWAEVLAMWRGQPAPEKLQEDMIERLRACVASWLAGDTPDYVADCYGVEAQGESDPVAYQRDAKRALALRNLKPGDLGTYCEWIEDVRRENHATNAGVVGKDRAGRATVHPAL